MKKTYLTSHCLHCHWISILLDDSKSSISKCDQCGDTNRVLAVSFSDQIGYNFDEFQFLFLKFNTPLSQDQKQFYEEHRRNFEIEFLL